MLSREKAKESRAGHLGRDRLGRQGTAKVEKQVEGSRKHTCSPELKKREISEVPDGMVEVDPKQQAI